MATLTAVDVREVALLLALRQHCLDKIQRGQPRTLVEARADPQAFAGCLYVLAKTQNDTGRAAGLISSNASALSYVLTADALAVMEPMFRPEMWVLREIELDGVIRWDDRQIESAGWEEIVWKTFATGQRPEALARRRSPLPDVRALLAKRLDEGHATLIDMSAYRERAQHKAAQETT